MVSRTKSSLYVVATPIGNLEDMTARAIRVLAQADLIAAEDTRHSAKLLHHFNITTKMASVHDHNERSQVPHLIELLKQGKSIALISDAGTPLLSDPGFNLVRAARAEGVDVVPVPGACAAIAALCAAGLPSDRFVFEGFPPSRQVARRAHFHQLAREPRTLVFYESTHRIVEALADMAHEFGDEREAVVARELTKKFEHFRVGGLGELAAWIALATEQQQGEFVVLVRGAKTPSGELDADAERVLDVLLVELPLKQAASLAAKITGASKNGLYQHALAKRR